MTARPISAVRPSAMPVYVRWSSRRAAYTAHWANTNDGEERDQHDVRRDLGDVDAVGQPARLAGSASSVLTVRIRSRR